MSTAKSKGAKKPPRNRELGRIHLLAKELGLTRDVYEAVIWTVGRQHSSKDLDLPGRMRVIAHLEGLLRDAKPEHAALSRSFRDKPHNLDRQQLLAKIQALLTDAGLPWTYAVAIARNQYGKDRLDFCSPQELGAVVAALHRPALKRLKAELQAIFGEDWFHPTGFYAAWLFGFPTGKRDVTRYAEPQSQVLRWVRGELEASCAWPVDLEKPKCCQGCHQRALRQAGQL